MKKAISFVKVKAAVIRSKTISILSDECGTGYTDVAIVILISVVLGAVLLGGLYALFNEQVLPTLSRKISEMFDYAG